ncbi:MAG TPA: glycosyltransferase family 4 protein [Candidatus Dormibacteraeota bacterium]|jgi:glycosyltransferase involved in cell wall biosynthesis
MRVLLLSQFYAPVIGGEERHVEALAGELALRGHRVSVATIAVPGAPAGETRDGVRVHRLRASAQRLPGVFTDPSRPHAAPLPDPELSTGIRRLVRAERPDVVHAHNWIVNSALWTGRPLVLTLHDYSHVCAVKRLMRDGAPCAGPAPVRCLRCAGRHHGVATGTVTALGTWLLRGRRERAPGAMIAVSEAVARGNRLAGSRLPVHVIPNFIPDHLWRAAGAPVPPGPRDPRLPAGPFLLFVGDLARDKGLHVLLEAHGRLRDPPPLVLMGRRVPDTPARLPDRVTLLEDCPHDLVAGALRRCAVALAPSVWPDPCPTVVLEAMAAGCALVTTSAGGIPDLVGEEGALTVPPGDPEALAGATRRLLGDQELRRSLGAAARRRARDFTAGRVVPRIEAVYRALVDGDGA